MTATVAELTAGMSIEAKAALVTRVRAQAARLRTIRECPTPLDLACRFDPTYVRTPALELLAVRLRDAVRERDGRLVVSLPPQQGKSSLTRWAIVWALVDDPDRRIVFASYAAGLARTSGRVVRGLIEMYGTEIGLQVSSVHADAADWELEGHKGGMFSTGRGAMTGRPSDWTVVDDPLRDQQEADSPVVRGALHDWWDTVARTRLAPGAPAVVIQTRWHEDDLAGRLVGEGWPLLNVPALADGKTEDALARPPGEWLVSARGTTAADWAKTRRDVGERTFAALYQGRPAPLEGGVFKAAWFDTWRVSEAPPGCLPSVVVVDPADNEGDGDEAGILVGTKHAASGKVYILDDLSAPMTVARWARLALLTCARRSAPTLAYEKSLSQLPKRIREAWANVWQQALALHHCDGDVDAALARLSRPDDSAQAREQILEELVELAPDATAILLFGESGPSLRPITARGTKTFRMQLTAPAFETGRAVMVGKHSSLEHQASTWAVGQDSPDRVDAACHLVQLLSGGSVASLGRPDERIPTSSTGAARRGGGSRIARSTGR